MNPKSGAGPFVKFDDEGIQAGRKTHVYRVKSIIGARVIGVVKWWATW